MLQSCQHDLLTRLLNLASKKDFVQNSVDLTQSPNQYSLNPNPISHITPPSPSSTRTHLVKVENKIQLANIPKELIQHLDKEMNSLQVCKLIIVSVHTDAEE